MPPSPALSLVTKAVPRLDGRTIGILVGDGADVALVAALHKAADTAGAMTKIIAPKISGAELSDGSLLPADFRIDGGPSCLFDAVAIVAGDAGAQALAGMQPAQDFVRDAYAHLKAIAFTGNAGELFARAGLGEAQMDETCIVLDKRADAKTFIEAAAGGKNWAREPGVRPLPQ